MITRTTLLLSAVLVWSCVDGIDTTDLAVPAAAQADVFGMAPEGIDPPNISAMTEEEREAYGNAMIQMRIAFERAMATPGGWKSADAQLRPLLDDYLALPQYQVQQTAGAIMLNTYLLSGEFDAAKADALGFYTRLMVDSSSPNAPLVERALTSLQGHWTDADIARAAASAVSSGERFLRAKTDCEDCSSTALLRRVQSDTPSDTRSIEVAAAVERLRTMM